MMYSHQTLDDLGRSMRQAYEEQGARERMARQAQAGRKAEATAQLSRVIARARKALDVRSALNALKSKLALTHSIG